MSDNPIEAFEKYALEFLKIRDTSSVGVNTVDQWARSLKTHANVLEIASGGGIPVTRTLINAGLKIRALDSSETLVAAFRDRYPAIPVQCTPVLESDFFQIKYDGVIAIGLIFLLDEADQFILLKKIAQILCPGGSLLFTAPVEAGKWNDVVTGHQCISAGEQIYLSMLKHSGFGDVRHHYDSGNNHYYEVKRIDGVTSGNTGITG